MPRSIYYVQDGRKPKPCPDSQHRPIRPKPVGSRLPTCRFCGWAYM